MTFPPNHPALSNGNDLSDSNWNSAVLPKTSHRLVNCVRGLPRGPRVSIRWGSRVAEPPFDVPLELLHFFGGHVINDPFYLVIPGVFAQRPVRLPPRFARGRIKSSHVFISRNQFVQSTPLICVRLIDQLLALVNEKTVMAHGRLCAAS